MSGNVERFEKAINQGHNAAWDQKWDEAARFYREAVEENPDDPKALTSLALALYNTEVYEEALKLYLKVAQLTPNDPIPLEKCAELLEKTGQVKNAIIAYMKCAELYLKNKDVKKSIDLWSRIVMIQPDYLIARSRLALVFERLGRKQEAIREYIAITSLFQKAGEVQKASQAVNRALQIDPGNANLKTVQTMVANGQLIPLPNLTRTASTQSSQHQQKIEQDSEEDALNPIEEAQKRALSLMAGLLFEQEETNEPSNRRGMSDIVRGDFGSISGHGEQTKIILHLSQVIELQSQQKERQAMEELERVLGLGFDHPAARFDLGYLQFRTEKYDEALETLEPIGSHADFSFAVKIIQGKIQFHQNQYHQASLDLLAALRLADTQVYSGQHLNELQDAYDPIIEMSSQQQNEEQLMRLCENILQMLDRTDWKQYLSEARKQLPDQDGTYPTPLAEMITTAGSGEIVGAMTRIQKYMRSENYNAAMEEAFYVLSSAPHYLPLHVTIADLLIKRGQIDAALRKYDTVARSYNVRGDANKSIFLYRKIADLSPMNLDARKHLIALIVRSNQTDAAIDEYLNLAETYYNLADLENVRKTINEALRLAQESSASRDVKFKILSQLVDIEMQSLNLRQAQHLYEQMRSIQPDHQPTRLSIVELFFRLGQPKLARKEISEYVNLLLSRDEKGKAENFLEKLLEHQPQEPVLLHQYGEYLRRVDRREEAIQKLDDAGEIYLAIGDKISAAEVIRSILAMNPTNAGQYQQLLAQLQN